ncbi:MAG: phytanoyl-CoA dioxygenase family protein [Fimbriimonadales bacterium]|nr:phytanoyl-CoA dioxygenase family protein [Fimbriimonadales bacterium]
MLDAEQVLRYRESGFLLVRRLFSAEEAEAYCSHYMDMNARGIGADRSDLAYRDEQDPLLRYPRILQPHRWDRKSLEFLLDPRLREILTALDGQEPLAVQTMFYFKPPGARGQAIHQDNWYLRARPGNCLAAWLAIDACDRANGCLQVVPGSHRLPLLCNVESDTSVSFTGTQVPLPEGAEIVDVEMDPGDVLFFDGHLIHGSLPNSTPDRFRRSLIAHYISGCAEQVASYYEPVYRFDGSVVPFRFVDEGGPCGVLVTRDGRQEIEMVASRGVMAEGPH